MEKPYCSGFHVASDKKHDFNLALKLVTKYLTHPHDLMHKACGWILREVGKQDKSVLTSFLNQYRLQMPRTMLRYAIEHYPEAERHMFMRLNPEE